MESAKEKWKNQKFEGTKNVLIQKWGLRIRITSDGISHSTSLNTKSLLFKIEKYIVFGFQLA